MPPPVIVAIVERVARVVTPAVRDRVATFGLAVTFLIVTVEKVAADIVHGYLAVDLRIYREAAIAVLSGGDPWSAGVDGAVFAGPPPSLLPYLPAALMPESMAIVVYWAAFSGAAVFAVWRLGLPRWWILFPPLSEGVLVINGDVLVIALVAAGGTWSAGSVLAKPYAAIPLALTGAWRPLLIAAAISALLVPLWLDFLGQRESITGALEGQAASLSAWGTWLMLPVLLALIVLRGRGAAWLVVPALWPFTQLHYACIAVPAVRRSVVLAFLFSFAVPLLPAFAVVLEAIRILVGRWLWRSPTWPEPSTGSEGSRPGRLPPIA